MTNASMTPGSRPRRGVIGVLALLGAGALTTAIALAAGEASDPPEIAGAVELATFTSCEDLAAWGQEAMGGPERFEEVGAPVESSSGDDVPMAVSGEGAEDLASSDQSSGAASSGGGQDGAAGSQAPMTTVTTPPTTAPVAEEPDSDEPEADEPSSDEPAPPGGEDGDDSSEDEATGDEGASDEGSDEAAEDETNNQVEGVDEIDLVDRLTDDVVLVASSARLAVVDLAEGEVVEATNVGWDAQITYDAENGVAWVVGHLDQGGVSVERYAVDPDDGLEPEGRWTTAGSLVDARRVGGELHLVATDGFLAQPVGVAIEGDMGVASDDMGTVPPTTTPVETETEAPDEAVPFGGGPVACDEVLHPVGPSDPSATLLATFPATGTVEPVRATEVVGSGSLVHVTTESIYLATPQWDEVTTTGIHRFDVATLEPTGSGVVEGTMLDQFSMSEHEGVLRVAVTQDGFSTVAMPAAGPAEDIAEPTVTGAPEPGVAGEALNEIIVLDTDGALDEVGRTQAFGKPGETIHGIRFAGDVGYAVTFLQTDPFYVVDLADPTAPAVVGEVELPGFSSYLHPLDDGLVVGFGPGEDGRTAAKLFDVSDPTAPAVVGDLVLGDDSAVAYDHHAYLDLGDGRFAVPAMSWEGGGAEVVVVDTAGGRLVEEIRYQVGTIEMPTRILTVDDGWALVAGAEIVTLDAEGATTARITL